MSLADNGRPSGLPPSFNKEGWGEIFPLPLESKRGTFTHHPASNPPNPPFVKGGIDLHGLPSEPRCQAGVLAPLILRLIQKD
jgi:hypothetical protein